MKRKKNKLIKKMEADLFIVRWVNFLLGLLLGLGLAILINLFCHPTGNAVTPLVTKTEEWPQGYGRKLEKVLDYLDHMSKTNDVQAADIHAMRERLAK